MARKKAPSPEAAFWAWFADHSYDLVAVRTAREPIVDQLTQQLRAVADGLCYEFGPTADGRREFIVSADGNQERFGAVKRLVALAPDLPGWQVIAFRPPKPLEGQTLHFGDVELSGDDVWFTSTADGGRIALELYVRGLDEQQPEPMAAPTFILLDATLGEFVVETRIGGIGWHALPGDPETEGLQPFRELSSTVALPIRRPVSLLDALDEGGEPPEPPEDAGQGEGEWTLAEMRRGDELRIVGLREDLDDHGRDLEYEVLVRVTFRDPSEDGLPDRDELDAARAYEDWFTARLKARCTIEKAVQMTGDGARDVYFYCSDPQAAIRVWEEELQPAIRSHQVAFYVRHSRDWEVLNGLINQRESAAEEPPELGVAAHDFLDESLADHRELVEELPRLWLPVHLFAFGVARGIAEAEGLPRNQMLNWAYTLFVRCLDQPTDEANGAMSWIIEHEDEEATAALIAQGHEAFAAWRAGEGGTGRLGEILEQMRQVDEGED